MSFEFDKVVGQYGEDRNANGVETASFGGDRGVNASFYRGRDPFDHDKGVAAREAGLPDYVERDYLRIEFPGDRSTVWDQPVDMVGTPLKPSDPKRFPREWTEYQTGQKVASGTALASWSAIGPADVKKFEALSIYTVEHLAEVSDGNLSALGLGGRDAREAARLHLLKLAADKPQAMTDELAELRAQVAALTANQDKPRRGRPPLEEAA